MKTEIKLKIAGIIIRIQSAFALELHTEEGQKRRFAERFNNFFYDRNQKPHIRIKVEIVDRLPKISNATNIFITYHVQDGKENWRLLKKGNAYIYKSPLEDKKQLMLVNKTFDTITAYLLPKAKKGKVWSVEDIIYDFLQILLINYFALHKKGIFVHSVGVKDLDGKGFLFAGKSGCGKTATAKLWHNKSKAMVLNDDRIIVRNHHGKFFIYGCPWHGEFSDYLHSKIESAPLENLFFIYHARDNTVSRISQKEAFSLLYPALFPTFWDKDHLENIVSFSEDLVRSVPCYSLGFRNNKRVIGFVRKLSTAKIQNEP